MKLLLDTHIFLWFANAESELSENAQRLIENTDNECFISIASLWEIAIKHSLGKLNLQIPFAQLLELAVENNIQVLGIEFSHITTLLTLPFFHKDPFDRMIISQAVAENLVVITEDAYFPEYAIQIQK